MGAAISNAQNATIDQRFAEQVWHQPQVEQSSVGGPKVVIFGLDPRVDEMLDGAFTGIRPGHGVGDVGPEDAVYLVGKVPAALIDWEVAAIAPPAPYTVRG